MGKFLKGLNRDINPVDQPAGTWRYARNMVIPPGAGTVQSEKGTDQIVNITAGYRVIGSCLLPDEKVCLFSTKIASPFNSEIGVFNPASNTYTVIYNDSACVGINKLNFKIEFPIQAEAKMDITGKISVYWTDDFNPMRYIKLYKPPVCPHDIEDFNIFPQLSECPQVTLDRMQTGVLTVGAYALTFALLDNEGTPTNYLDISLWVYITPNTSPESNATTALGANAATVSNMGFVSNIDGHPPMSYQGGEPGTAGAKGIIFKITNLDPRYSFIRPVILKREAGVITAHQLQDLDYDITASTSILVSYTGNEQTEAIAIEEVLIPRDTYTKAKTVAQVDDTLYWGNLEKNTIDIGYQPYAMGIKVMARQINDGFDDLVDINAVTNVNMNINIASATNAMRDAKDKYDYTGYQRDEVYAFYISWITVDGNETVAYHIPGRPPLDIDDYAGAGLKEDDLACLTVNDVPYMDTGDGVGISQLERMGQNNPATATVQIGDLTTWGSNLTSTKTGYWENKNETYPTDVNYNGLDHNGNSLPSLQYGNGITPVRHHHMPSACVGEGGGHPYGGPAGYYKGQQKLNPLAVKITNIPFPDFMIGKVLSYRIYYAKRTEGNSLVVDTGILNLMPSAACSASDDTWGACEENGWNNSFIHPLNGFDTNGYHAGGSWGATGYEGTVLVKDYAMNAPPGGDDYASWSGNFTGGSVVAYPFSCVHAPYSDIEHGGYLDRHTKEPRGNHFSFNGLYTRMMDPDISNVSYMKIQRHFRQGRPDATNAFMGAYFIRKDQGGSKINSTTGQDEDRMYILFDWTQNDCQEYDDNKTYGVLYNTGEVGGSAGQSCGTQYPYFRAIGMSMNIPADQIIDAPNSPAGEIVNSGGCQTTYLYT